MRRWLTRGGRKTSTCGPGPLEVDVETHGAHVVAVEWCWENVDGWRLVGPDNGAPLPLLRIVVTQMDDCDD